MKQTLFLIPVEDAGNNKKINIEVLAKDDFDAIQKVERIIPCKGYLIKNVIAVEDFENLPVETEEKIKTNHDKVRMDVLESILKEFSKDKKEIKNENLKLIMDLFEELKK